MKGERHINEEGLRLIKSHEGFSAVPYRCPAGYWTIGFGHLITKGEAYNKITPEEGERLLQMDLLLAEQSVERLVHVPLTDNQFSALVSFTFNIGMGAFSNSTLLWLLNEGKYQDAAGQFQRWVYGGGKRLEGLVRRRLKERELFLKGD